MSPKGLEADVRREISFVGAEEVFPSNPLAGPLFENYSFQRYSEKDFLRIPHEGERVTNTVCLKVWSVTARMKKVKGLITHIMLRAVFLSFGMILWRYSILSLKGLRMFGL